MFEYQQNHKLKFCITDVHRRFKFNISVADPTQYQAVLRSRSRWSRNYLGPGAEIKFLINIFCSQFGGCYDEDKLISTSISIVLLF